VALSYASTSDLKRAMGITDVTDDVLLARYADEANTWLEGRIGRPVGPASASTTRFFDGTNVRRKGRVLHIPGGVLAIGSLAVAAGTGEAYHSVPSSDWFLRPYEWERDSGWGATEVWMTDNVSSANEWGGLFPTSGFAIAQAFALYGLMHAIPADLSELATRLGVSAYRARAYGTGGEYAVGEDGERVFEREMSARDWGTVRFYRELRHSGVR